MKKVLLCLALFIAGSMSAAVYGQKTETDSEKLIKAASFLEQKPLDESARGLRSWAITYIIATDEVSVVLCGGDLTKPLFDKKYKYGTELFGQYTIEMAAFKLRNPDKKDDENAAQLAGIESSLRAYEAIAKEKPKSKTAGIGDLIAKRDKGELKDLVYAVNCGKK